MAIHCIKTFGLSSYNSPLFSLDSHPIEPKIVVGCAGIHFNIFFYFLSLIQSDSYLQINPLVSGMLMHSSILNLINLTILNTANSLTKISMVTLSILSDILQMAVFLLQDLTTFAYLCLLLKSRSKNLTGQRNKTFPKLCRYLVDFKVIPIVSLIFLGLQTRRCLHLVVLTRKYLFGA